MLIRKLKRGDCLTVGGIVIQVRKTTADNLSIAIAAPAGMEIHHAREGREEPTGDKGADPSRQ